MAQHIRLSNRTREEQLDVKYADILPAWEAALQDNGTMFTEATVKDATTIMFKLHRYRYALGLIDANRFIFMQRFIVQRYGATIKISPKKIFDVSRLRKLDGTPITPLEPQITQEQMDRAAAFKEQQARYDPAKDPGYQQLMDEYLKDHPHVPDPRLQAQERLRELEPEETFIPTKPMLHEHDPSKPLFGDDDFSIIQNDDAKSRK